MKTLSYILLYGVLATCGLASAEELTAPRGTSPQQVAYTNQHRELIDKWLQLTHGLVDAPARHFTRLERLTSDNLPPQQYRKSWYLLGRALYGRGEYEAAAVALARIGGRLPEDVRQDFTLLRAQVLMAQSDYERAAAVLGPLAGRRSGSPYAQYNLAVALLRAGHQSQAIDTLETLGSLPAGTVEAEALRDQANITLGYLYLERRKAKNAREALQRASLNGPYANHALLALGWVEWQARNPRLAQSAWTELLDGDPASPITQEALSGVPQALWRLESHTQARKKFDAAITAYQTQLSRLDDIIGVAREEAWLTMVLADASPDDLNARTVWQRMDHTALAPYLRALSEDPGLQQNLQHYLALLRLNNLTASPSRLQGAMAEHLGIVMSQPIAPGLERDLQRMRQQIPFHLARLRRNLREQALEVLARQRQQLRQYLVNAQYALARLLDELANKKS